MSSTPRHVRNFFIELEVDGKKHKIRTGPNRKDGGFYMVIYQRDRGGVSVASRISGIADGDDLTLKIQALDGEINVNQTVNPALTTKR